MTTLFAYMLGVFAVYISFFIAFQVLEFVHCLLVHEKWNISRLLKRLNEVKVI